MSTGLLLGAGCGDSEDEGSLGDCPPNSDADSIAGLLVLDERCASCHSGTATGGAAAGLDFSIEQVVVDNADRMYAQVEAGTMPPGAPLTDDEVELVRVALACVTEAQ